jgi:hypothetical protein
VVQIGKSPAAVKVIEDLIGNPGLVQKALSILGIRAQPELIAAETLRKLSDADRGALILEGESLGLTKSFLSHSNLDASRYSIEGWKLKLNEPIQFNLPARGTFKLDEIDLKAPTATLGGSACALLDTCTSKLNQLLDRIAPGHDRIAPGHER